MKRIELCVSAGVMGALLTIAGCGETPYAESVVSDNNSTRAHYDPVSKNMFWDNGDKFAVVYATPSGGFFPDIVGSAEMRIYDVAVEVRVTLPVDTLPGSADGWYLGAVYPETAWRGCTSRQVRCNLPAAQTPDGESFDPQACLVFGTTSMQSGEVFESPSTKEFDFNYPAAFGALTVIPPTDVEPDSPRVGVNIEATKPLAGDLLIAADGSTTFAETVNRLTLAATDWDAPLMFCALPCDLTTGDELTVSLVYGDGVIRKTFYPKSLSFIKANLVRFTARIASDYGILADEGAVLWSDSFAGAVTVDSGASSPASGIGGSYDPAAEGSGCRLFWNADRASLVYGGAYAKYTEDFQTGTTVVTVDNRNGFVSFGDIPACGATGVRLSFETTASTGSVEAGFDGEWSGVKSSIQYNKGGVSYVDVEVPEGTQSLSFRLYTNVSYARSFGNFTLTVTDSGLSAE